MKNLFWLPVVSLFAFLLPTVIAYGERGVSERMLYYMAYLCEEEVKALDSSYEFTIAPSCPGSRGGRCTLDEFLLYIWKAKPATDPDTPIHKQDITPPTSMTTSTDITGEDGHRPGVSMNQFFGAIENAEFNTGFGADGNVDNAKLMPGSTDYYDMLSKMGKPIEAFSQAVMKVKKANPKFAVGYRLKMWGLAKDCTSLVTALRRKNMDSFRTEYLRKNIPGINIVYGNWVTGMQQSNSKDPMQIQVMDVDGTIAASKDAVPDIKDQLRLKNKDWLKIPRTVNGKTTYPNSDHNVAAEAGRASMHGCNCEKRGFRGLRRRENNATQAEGWSIMDAGKVGASNPAKWEVDPMAVNWGGPKAARSRNIRAQKLKELTRNGGVYSQ